MIVITVGKNYIDIDGYASCLAYRELLKIQGIDAKFVSNSVLNYGITKSLLDLPFHIDDYRINPEDKFIILDLSDKLFFPDFVLEDNIIEIIDHHPGSESYWKDKLGNDAIIEQIGAVATIIVEKYEKYNMLHKMDKSIAKLLMAAILDNTLNFTAKITKERDKIAYKKLEQITQEYNFARLYFNECQSFIETNLTTSIVNDLKIQKVNEYLPEVLGQLTIWNINKLLEQMNTIRETMSDYGAKWLINIISLEENKSYIMYSNNDIADNINKLFDCACKNEMLIINPAILRKEIIRRALEK